MQEKQPVLLNGKREEFTISVQGKLLPCPQKCGCNVYHKPDQTRLNLYQCNGCGVEFTAD